MNYKRLIPLFVTVAVLFGIIAVSSNQKTSIKTGTLVATNDNATSSTKEKKTDDNEELRGMWLTYMELSMENDSDKSENAFRNKFNAIAETCRMSGFNTIIAQVRPFGDALYNSEYYPYSHILTGEQGKNPEYDALKIMCEICHSKNLKIHAWINPYRVKISQTPAELSEDNPYVKDNSLGFETESGIYLYPSNKKSQELIENGIEEIVKNYDVDGIQFDDYFYPPDMNDEDIEQYEQFKADAGENCMSLEKWRFESVNLLIAEVYRKIHNISDNVDFGISPQGNINNNSSLYADVEAWCEHSGYIDYICPQIYFSLDNPALSFENALDSWCKLDYNENTKLYVGLAGYKAGSESDSNTWLSADNILAKEYEILSNNGKVSGFILYSYDSLKKSSSSAEIKNLTECFANTSN